MSLAGSRLTRSMHGMRVVVLVAIYLVLVFAGGAVLAPCVYWATIWLASYWPSLAWLAEMPFHRYVHRSILFLAFVGAWPMLRVCGMWSWQQVRAWFPACEWKRWTTGLLTGWLFLTALGVVVVLFEGRSWNTRHGIEELARRALGAASTGLAVGVLEEVLFRGVLLGVFLRRLRVWAALIVSSAIYSLTHFLGRAATSEEPGWLAGFEALSGMLGGLLDVGNLVPAALTLGLVGMALGWCYVKTGNLWLSMGLHTGMVFQVKVYGFMTREAGGMGAWFWGTRRMIDGWFAVLGMLLFWWVCHRLVRNDRQEYDSALTEGSSASAAARRHATGDWVESSMADRGSRDSAAS